MVDQEDPLVGRVVLGRFRIVRQLARGGMGLIYLARAEGGDGFVRPVVVKRVAPHLVADERMVKSFAREARIMSNLRHPSIVAVIDYGREHGDSFMVLEYVRGHHLGRWLHFVQTKRGPFPVHRALHITLAILDALQYAHTLVTADGEATPVIHRDVTPANVLVDVDGPVKLADFGIATMQSDATETSGGDLNVRGKMAYLAPELLRFEPPSPATDTYSAAVVLHELLIGHNELRGSTPETTVAKVLEHVPSRVDALRKDVPRALGLVIARALSKEPNVRFATADALASALRALRLVDAHDAAAEIAKAASADFKHPDFQALTGAEDLIALDRAWRDAVSQSITALQDSEPTADAPPSLRSPSTPPPRSGSGPQRLPSGRFAASDAISPEGADDAAAKPKPAAPAWLRIGAPLAAVAAVAAAIGATVAKVVETDDVDLGTSYVLVSGEGDPNVTTGQTDETGDAGASPVAASSADAASESTADDGGASVGVASRADTGAAGSTTPRPPRGRPTAEALSRTFARESSRIARCFAVNLTEGQDVPAVSIRFRVDGDGRVQSAEILPAAVSGTPLGRCISGIARGTHFGPIGEPITFRIPVSARRRGGG
ncbi:MAG: serine/threonine protein kinase [Deltaproteobacteria bacterium]|nr:serine/threonine protein kinase [Deltaproteobacteria bacterium]